jgi:uncharacterized membrane protein
MNRSNISSLIYKPFNLLYLAFLVFLLFTIATWFLSFFRGLLIQSVGIPQEYFWAVTLLSLIGSYVNIPLMVLESNKQVPQIERVESFGVVYEIPKVDVSSAETLVLINLGGAIIPTIISLYLLIVSIPGCSDNLLFTYVKVLIVLVVVSVSTHRSAQIVDGLGITTPAWGPPTMTVFIIMLINYFSPITCPTQVAYVGGSLGALIGADLMNMGRVAGVGPVVSIGGAGTFDGVYLTGLASVLLLLFIS